MAQQKANLEREFEQQKAKNRLEKKLAILMAKRESKAFVLKDDEIDGLKKTVSDLQSQVQDLKCELEKQSSQANPTMPRHLEKPFLNLTRNFSAENLPLANSNMTSTGFRRLSRAQSGTQAFTGWSPNRISSVKRSKRLEMYLKKVQKRMP